MCVCVIFCGRCISISDNSSAERCHALAADTGQAGMFGMFGMLSVMACCQSYAGRLDQILLNGPEFALEREQRQ